jgi:hypothetical protein
MFRNAVVDDQSVIPQANRRQRLGVLIRIHLSILPVLFWRRFPIIGGRIRDLRFCQRHAAKQAFERNRHQLVKN